jgi:hypothetical protein
VNEIFNLEGALQYREEGLQLCISALNMEDSCTVSPENFTQKYCMGADICTARCHCTADGNSLRDTDIEPFLSSDIDNQGQDSDSLSPQ